MPEEQQDAPYESTRDAGSTPATSTILSIHYQEAMTRNDLYKENKDNINTMFSEHMFSVMLIDRYL